MTLATDYATLRLVDAAIAKATGVSDQSRIDRIEAILFQYINGEWVRLADRAIRVAVRDFLSGARADQLAAQINRTMRRWGKVVSPRISEEIDDVYRIARDWMWRRVHGRAPGVERTLGTPTVRARKAEAMADFSFDLTDERAIDALQRHQLFWVGRHYDAHIARQIRDVARDVMVETGEDRVTAARELERRFRDTLTKVVVPGGYAGSAKSYFEGLVANAVTSARTHGQLRSLREAGIERYEWIAVGDDRTCEVCAHMDGKIFLVNDAFERAERIAAAQTPEAVKQLHPWLKFDALRRISPNAGRQSFADSRSLKGAGFDQPPAHFKCRCALDMDISRV